ncbi:hypothetical protein [Rhizobium rhizoryzae]|uniref:DNA-binding CsgD family transcriptional regulator n=1 Tax=Rhizobium rhizoryzae TaxID=451876 RepID=A0A7W6PSS6_9HYPH|nr:hypothetical protein [Rhizobium rhizoryzae]MBB4145858.1 DNA-binding CsgD family transcriptional regulator [Rhizobium rhizoryzae]
MTAQAQQAIHYQHPLRQRECVLKLWRDGQHSTFCIARELDLAEDEVCHIIRQAEDRQTASCREAR